MDDEDLYDDDQTPDPKQQAREQYEKRAERKADKLQAQLDEALRRIQQFEKQETQRSVASVFKDAGLNDKWARLYLSENDEGEHTVDRARAWAVENGLAQPPEETPSAEAPSQGWTPTVVADGSVDASVIDYDKAMEMLKTDPERLEREFAKGNITLEKLPGNLA